MNTTTDIPVTGLDGTSQEEHNTQMATFLEEFTKKGKSLTSAQALDAIDLGGMAEENSAILDPENIQAAFGDIFQGVVDSYKDGQNGRAAFGHVVETSSKLDGTAAVDSLDAQIKSSNTSFRERMAATMAVDAVSGDSNKMFSDPAAGKHALRQNELQKTLDEGRGATGREDWDTSKRMSWFGGISEADEERAWEGFFDGAIGEAMFITEFVANSIKDAALITTRTVGEGFFPDTGQMLSDYAVWHAYTNDRRLKDPTGYGEGVGPGRVTGAFLSPADLATMHVAGTAVKATGRGLGLLKTSHELRASLGSLETIKVAKSSHKGLVEAIQTGDEEFVGALSKQVGRDNPLSEKITAAIVDAKGKEIIETEIKNNQSAMSSVVHGAVNVEDHNAVEAVGKSVLKANNPRIGEEIRAALETGEATPLTLVGTTHSGIHTPTTDLGVQLNNAANMEPVSDALEYAALTTRQALVEGQQSIHIKQVTDDMAELNMGVSAESWKGKARGAVTRFTMPGTAKFKGSAKREIIDNFTVADHLTRVIKRANSEMHKSVWKGLKKTETDQLNRMAYAANEAESWGKIIDNEFMIVSDGGDILFREAASPKVLDAFVARKRMINHTKDNIEHVLRAQAESSGVKLFNGTKLSRELHGVQLGDDGFDLAGNEIKFNSEMERDGWRVAKVDVDSDDVDTVLIFLDKAQWESKVKSIPADYEMVPTTNGYMRQEYKPVFRVMEITKDTDKVHRVGKSDIQTEVYNKQVASLEKRIDTAERKALSAQQRVNAAKSKNTFEDGGDIAKQLEKAEAYRDSLRAKLEKVHETHIPRPDNQIGYETVALEAAEYGTPLRRAPKFEPVATADTTYEATLLIKQAEAEGRLMIAVRAEPGQMDAAFSNEFMSSFIRMSEVQVAGTFESMLKAGYPQEAIDQLRVLHNKYGKFNPAFKPASALKHRRLEGPLPHVGKSGELGAPQLRVAKEADAIYMDWAADYMGKVPYMEELKEQFLQTYGKYLSKPGDFLSPIEKGLEPKILDEVRAFQNQLRLMTGRKGAAVVYGDKKIMAVTDRMMNSENRWTRKLGQITDNNLSASGMVQDASKITTQSKLGMGSMVQLGLQASFGVMAGTGASLGRMAGRGFFREGKALGLAYSDFIQSLGPRAFKGLRFTKGGKDAHKFLERWGVLEGIDWDGLATQLSDIRKQRGMAKKTVSRATQVGAIPFVEGEKLNQVFGILTSRRVLESEIKAGKHATLTSKDLLNGGSAKFGREVLLRGKTLSLNMARHNAPGFSQNELAAMALKFKEFVSHGTNLYLDPFLAKNLSKREMLGIYATTVAVLGPKGVPMLWDALTFAEGTANTILPGKPDYTGVLTQDMWLGAAKHLESMSGGAIDAKATYQWMTQGGNALANRMMMASVFSDYVEGAGNDEVMLGPVYATIKGMLGNGWNTADKLFEMMHAGEYDLEVLALEATEEFVGPNNMLRALESKDKGRVLSRTGKTLLADPSLKDRLLLASGVTPLGVTVAYDYNALRYRKQKVISDWIKDKIEQTNQVYQTNPTLGEEFIDSIQADIEEVDPALSATFLKGMMSKIGANGLDVKSKAYMDAVRSGQIETDTARILGLEEPY